MSGDDKARREGRSHGEDYPGPVDADTPEDHHAASPPTAEPEGEPETGADSRKPRGDRGGVRSVGDVAARFGPEERDR
jgi:hypothetical protein